MTTRTSRRLLFVLALLLPLVLAACQPATVTQQVADGVLGDCAVLRLLPDGFEFDPVCGVAEGVQIDVLADEITMIGAPCVIDEAEERVAAALCELGDVAGVVFVPVEGVGVDAFASFRRPGSSRVYLEFAIR